MSRKRAKVYVDNSAHHNTITRGTERMMGTQNDDDEGLLGFVVVECRAFLKSAKAGWLFYHDPAWIARHEACAAVRAWEVHLDRWHRTDFTRH